MSDEVTAEPKRRTHHSVPISYPPKMDAVFDGLCRQTIRMGRKYAVGDRVTFFEWSGRPYRSKWGRRLRVVLDVVQNIVLYPEGIMSSMVIPIATDWDAEAIDALAAADFIDPPTGVELKRVLEAFHGPITKPIETQILRW